MCTVYTHAILSFPPVLSQCFEHISSPHPKIPLVYPPPGDGGDGKNKSRPLMAPPRINYIFLILTENNDYQMHDGEVGCILCEPLAPSAPPVFLITCIISPNLFTLLHYDYF